MCNLEKLTEVESETAEFKAEQSLLSRGRALRRLKASGKFLSKKKLVPSVTSNKIIFDTIFKPRSLFSHRQAHSASAYFWGHRNNEFKRLVPEVGEFAHVSSWRLASLNARHETNELFDEDRSSKRQSVLQRVIESMGDCPSLLAQLASNEAVDIRIAVAENGFANLATMFALAGDENPDVRLAIAENHNAPIAILQFLGDDSNPYVVSRAQRTLSRLIQGSDVSKSLLSRLSRPVKRRARA